VAVRLTAETVASASALAASTGQPVEVLSARTDYSQTFANPNGGFTLDESPVPVRVQQPDGSWVQVDPTLSVQPDGSVRPAAITTGLVLSGGGNGPLYTLSQGGESLAVSWPGGALPVPTLSGATATYANVLPGVNMLVTATPTGVSELLQVTSAQAAANPALASLAFPVAAQGLSLSADGSGVVSAADNSGAVQYSALAPQMWDSAGLPDGPAAAGPVPGDHVASVGVSVSPGSLSLTPPASLLQGGSTVYPVYIDPEFNTQDPNSWSDVARNGAGSTWGDWEYQDAAFGGVRAGVSCQPDSNGNCIYPFGSTWVTYRSFLNFSIPASIWGAGYVDARLQTTMMWAWSCHPGTQVNLYYTNAATRAMTWPGPAEKAFLDSSTSAFRNGDSNCNQNGVTFDATPAAQDAARNHYTQLTLELRANDWDESHWNVYSWRRFAESSMNLQINYRHAPDPPAGQVTAGVFDPATGQTTSNCASGSPGDYTSANTPVMQAADTDVDGANGGKITTQFNWVNITNNSSYTVTSSDGYQTPAFTFHGSSPGTIADGNSYKWQAYGQTQSYTDGIGNTVPNLTGPRPSTWCYFTVDRSPPSAAASIYSAQYSGQSPPVGTPGTFQFTDPGNLDPPDNSNDVVGYKYGFSNPPTAYVPVPAPPDANRTAQVTITPFNPAGLTLYVQPVDRAGLLGPGPTQFAVNTVPPGTGVAKLAWWKLNAGSGTNAADSSQHGNDATLWQPGSSLGCGSSAAGSGYLCTLSLDGSVGRAFTSVPVVGNNGSFSVSAWVYLNPNPPSGKDQVAVSQAGTNVSGFTLGYDGTCLCWSFEMPANDSTSATVYKAQSSLAAATGTWTQLTGVFDPNAPNPNGGPKGALTLYVKGAQAGQVWGVSEWGQPALGLLRLGADGTSGAGPDFWNGQLSATCVFYGALNSQQIGTLAALNQDGCASL
jgi:hypothetical protein